MTSHEFSLEEFHSKIKNVVSCGELVGLIKDRWSWLVRSGTDAPEIPSLYALHIKALTPVPNSPSEFSASIWISMEFYSNQHARTFDVLPIINLLPISTATVSYISAPINRGIFALADVKFAADSLPVLYRRVQINQTMIALEEPPPYDLS